MTQIFQQEKHVLLGSTRTNQGGNEAYDQVISRHCGTYQWARQRRFSMERQCLIHLVLHTLQAVEGLEFLEEQQADDEGHHDEGTDSYWVMGESWVRASEVRVRQAVIGSLETSGLSSSSESDSSSSKRHN